MKIHLWTKTLLVTLCQLFMFAVACTRNTSPHIAFASERDGNWEIYLMDTYGTNLVNLTNNPSASDLEPKWSPNGQFVAFTSNGASSGDIVIANLDGEVIGKHNPENGFSDYPTWSPDGKHISFHSTIDGNFEIYTMKYNGNNLNRLTYDAFHDDSCPYWSPDGKFIAFGSGEMGGFDLHIMKTDGSDLTNSLGTWGGGVCPLIDWSPDGKYLAAVSWNLFVINSKSEIHQIIAECAKGYPDWSPDGARIIFSGDDCTNNLDESEIFIINSDGSELIQLTDNSYGDYSPSWSPDGEKIVFVSTRDGNREIYTMNTDGSNQVNLTKNDSDDVSPTWKP